MELDYMQGDKDRVNSQDYSEQGTHKKEKQLTDWSLCLFCQISTKDKLVCPSDSKRQDSGAGYHTLENDLKTYHELIVKEMSLDISRLDEGEGFFETFSKRKAKWHKKCRDTFNATKLSRLLKRKKTSEESGASASSQISPKKFRSHEKNPKLANNEPLCIFCDEGEKPSSKLHCASTFGLDSRVRSAALQVRDTKLLAKLSASDVVAVEMKYHLKCLSNLYNHARSIERQSNSAEEPTQVLESIAFAELVSFVEEQLTGDNIPVLKLADLVKMYSLRLEQLSGTAQSRVNSTCLKEKLLGHIPGLQAHSKGKDVLLIQDADVGRVLAETLQMKPESDAICLTRAANVIRRDLFESKFTFDGSFEPDCQEQSIPPYLLAIVRMILEGPNIVRQTESKVTPAALSIAQLVRYNSVKNQRRKSSSIIRHEQHQEMPLPLYIGVMIHAQTRKRGLIDKLFELGLCVSYDRVLQLSTDLANAVCDRYQSQKVVAPSAFKTGVFTTGAVDNLDHNPSSTTAAGSFHGTGISLFQHPSFQGEGEDLEPVAIQKGSSTFVHSLPEFYSSVPPAPNTPSNPAIPAVVCDLLNHRGDNDLIQNEYTWLREVKSMHKQELGSDRYISWSAFNATEQLENHSLKCSSALLPLFEDSAHSIAMIKHSMAVIRDAVEFLNPGQIPLMACDQPLFAIAKNIQWTWPDEFGEHKYVIMFGGLHIEMAAWKAAGTWLEQSGWSEALTLSDVASAGRAESYLNAAHLTRTRYAHEVTAAALYILQQDAYEEYLIQQTSSERPQLFEDWCVKMGERNPQFMYWSLVLELELTVLAFLRSIRTSNFKSYVNALEKLMPWFFALNRTNYARWLSVHIKDMRELDVKHPQLAVDFTDGKFTFQKTKNPFSALPLDQAHEQNNEIVKGDGGAIGLTENPQALRRWMVGGPETARVVHEFEDIALKSDTEKHGHHEQTRGAQCRFKAHVEALVDTMTGLGNPFTEESKDLISLSTKDIADPATVKTLYEVKDIGTSQYESFVKERLVEQTKSFTESIPHNKLSLFKDRKTVSHTSSATAKLRSAKSDCQLFARLYIGCQNRGGNLDDFFCHENQPSPPSLSDRGRLRGGSKSDLMKCFDRLHEPMENNNEPLVTAAIFDGAALVQMLKPGDQKTFQEYSEKVFIPYIENWLAKTDRADVVWDIYDKQSLKSSLREKRGIGNRRRVMRTVAIPRNWQNFLRVDANKTELFHMLSQDLSRLHILEKEVVSTYDQGVFCSPEREDTAALSPCSHEEADTRIIVHYVDALKRGHRKIMIRTVDTDVVVLSIAAFALHPVDELWIAFGTGSHYRFLPIHHYAVALGPVKSRALPYFHAFTGCDTVSFMAGRGKKTAWDVWMAFDDATEAFLELSAFPPRDIPEATVTTLERFTVLLYDRTSGHMEVNEARKHLFTKKGRQLESIPPSQAALQQHIRRAAYQGGHVWGQSTTTQQVLPSPTDWGWKLDGDMYQPLWTTLPEAAKSCAELVHCGCKKGCSGRCKCVKAGLSCTSLCACDGKCSMD